MKSEMTEAVETPKGTSLGYKELLYVVFFGFVSFLVASIVVGGMLLFGAELLSEREIDFEQPFIKALTLIVIQVVGWVLLLVFIYLLITVQKGLVFRQVIAWVPLVETGDVLEESPNNTRSHIQAILIFCSIGFGLACSVAAIASVLPTPDGRPPFEELLQNPSVLLLMVLLGTTIFPVVEEVLFRGFFFAVIEVMHGVWIAILTTSIVFSVVHGPQYGWHWQSLMLLFFVALVFATIRARTGSVIPVILTHAGYNATLLLAALFLGPTSG